MAFIKVVYGSDKELDDANQIADTVESISDVDSSIEKVNDFGNLNLDSADGFIAVGGQNANDVYSFMVKSKGWATPERPVLDESNPLYPLSRIAVATEPTKFQGALFQGVAGYTEEDTNNVVDGYTGDVDTGIINFSLRTPLDEFIEEVKLLADDEDVDIEDPNDPIIEDPIEPDPPEDDKPPEDDNPNVPELPKKVEVEGVKLNFPDVEPYSMAIDGWVKNLEDKFDNLANMDVGEVKKDFTVEAKTGGGDRDAYVVSSDAVITDFEADSDKWIYINGERYRYKADRDVIEADGVPIFAPNTGDEDDTIDDDEKSEEQKEREEEREEEKNQNIVDELVDMFNNPLKPENTAKIVLLGILSILLVRVIGLYDST